MIARLTPEQRETAARLYPSAVRVAVRFVRRFPWLEAEIVSAVGLGVCESAASYDKSRGLTPEDYAAYSAHMRVRSDLQRLALSARRKPALHHETEPLWFQRYAEGEAPGDAIDRLLAPLSPATADAVRRTVIEELSDPAAARAGETPDAVRQRRRYGLKRLRDFHQDCEAPPCR